MRLVFYCFFILFFLQTKLFSQEILSDSYFQDFRNAMLEHLEVKQQEAIMELDSIKVKTNSLDPITPEDIEIFRRSKLLSKTIPLEYNDQVKYFIDKYISSNYRPYMNKLLGLSKHYFPIYESILKESGVPEEVKYLSLVESSLNPHLVSRSGAVGPWQFMYVAAKEYNLEMSTYLDERKDAYSSSYAVSQYLTNAYNQFGDWLLALASYNCGRGCVQRAIARSGLTQPTFWELSPFLPQETRNYIPKYIAMTYVLSDPSYYDISPDVTDLALEHKVVFISKTIDIENVATAIGLSNEDLKKYNPAYKRNLINGSVEKPNRLLLPITNTTNDSLLYIALNDHNHRFDNIGIKDDKVLDDGIINYKVRGGETLAQISRKFGVSVQNLKAWNGLSTRSSIVGKTLLVNKPINENLAKHTKSVVATKKETGIVVYTVKKGDSLDGIANSYNGLSVNKLKADNGLKSNLIKPGMRLKIYKGKG